MEKFDAGRPCPKCGNLDVASMYYKATSVRNYARIISKDTIERHCRRCGYSWDELPLDAKELEE